MISRRTFLKLSGLLIVLLFSRSLFSWLSKPKVLHILCSASSDKLAATISLSKGINELFLKVDEKIFNGTKIDREGKHWQFICENLRSNRTYSLSLVSKEEILESDWPLKTLPNKNEEVNNLKIMAFTCAGGGDGTSFGGKEFFKPFVFRQKMFDEGISNKPDIAIAIGDHVYWDLRGGDLPPLGRQQSAFIKFLIGGLLKFLYGSFNRNEDGRSDHNEMVLKNIGNDQIASLYGKRFKSIPIFFLPDDHDYFENDDAEENLVTFPADEFSKSAFKGMADLFYPPLLDCPSDAIERKIGRIRYGSLFEGLLADCAGDMSLGGKQASLVHSKNEDWILSRFKKSSAKHLAFIPSHPLGYTAGKWREWYPDVVASDEEDGTIMNELLSGKKGKLTTKAEKYLWQKGWFLQHQRFLKGLSDRKGNSFTFSGDIHAIGSNQIIKSGDYFLKKPILSTLVGPISSSTGTWPSAARGIIASKPEFLDVNEKLKIREENGFSLINITNQKVDINLHMCGGHGGSEEDDGSVKKVINLQV